MPTTSTKQRGIACHLGRKLKGGHYISFVWNGGKCWKYDDAHIEVCHDNGRRWGFGSPEVRRGTFSMYTHAYMPVFEKVS